MKRFFPYLLVVMLVLAFSNSSWAQFPCWPGDSVGTSCCGADSSYHPSPEEWGYSVDLGNCDTLHVVPWPETDTCFIDCGISGCDTICINNPGENFPCFLYVNLLVTHDSNTFWWGEALPPRWMQDSISCFVVPLAWTRTNPTAYCSLSTYWNENKVGWWWPEYPRSVFRHFPKLGSDSLNRYEWLVEQGMGWDFEAVHLCSDSCWHFSDWVPPHAFLALFAQPQTARRWWEGSRTLLATLTFRVADTMHICIDSTFWPPNSNLLFVRYDAPEYVPRDNLPLCIWVGPSPQVVTSPNGGENWCVRKTEEITWYSDSLSSYFARIDYSTNAGASWLLIVDSTQNDGSHFWTIPDTPSDSCLVRVSDAEDGYPYDKSNDFFTIFLAGDADADGMVDIDDMVYLIKYLFINGPAPIPFEAGDVNLDGKIDVADVVYLINYIFLNGPPPLC